MYSRFGRHELWILTFAVSVSLVKNLAGSLSVNDLLDITHSQEFDSCLFSTLLTKFTHRYEVYNPIATKQKPYGSIAISPKKSNILFTLYLVR